MALSDEESAVGNAGAAASMGAADQNLPDSAARLSGPQEAPLARIWQEMLNGRWQIRSDLGLEQTIAFEKMLAVITSEVPYHVFSISAREN